MSEIDPHTLGGHLSKLVEDCESLTIVFGMQNACTRPTPWEWISSLGAIIRTTQKLGLSWRRLTASNR
jgi:hypothetical protein